MKDSVIAGVVLFLLGVCAGGAIECGRTKVMASDSRHDVIATTPLGLRLLTGEVVVKDGQVRVKADDGRRFAFPVQACSLFPPNSVNVDKPAEKPKPPTQPDGPEP